MNNIRMFGQKELFAIEVAGTPTRFKYKLRFWIRGKSVGEFKKSGELKYSIKELKRFIDNKEEFYLDLFDSLPPARIYYYLTDLSLLLSGKASDLEEFDRRKFFYLLFGEQFNSGTSGIILLYKQGNIMFLLPQKGGVKVDMIEVSYDEFFVIALEYIDFVQAMND